MVDGRRTVLAPGPQPLALRTAPRDSAPVAAYLRPRAIAVLGGGQGAWRQLSAGGASGWVKPDEVWGLAPAVQCTLSAGFAPANAAR
jgi:SH3-like domain-containing protein